MLRPTSRPGLVLVTLALVWGSACGQGRDVHGGLRALRLMESREVFFPLDLRSDRFTAYVEHDGDFDTYPGIGYSDGIFIVARVPEGEYVLRHDAGDVPAFFATTSDDIDLTSASLGRTDLQVPQQPSLLELSVAGLEPWRSQGRLEMVAANSGIVEDLLSVTSSRTPRLGDSALSGLAIDFAAQRLPLLDEGRGDRLQVTQLVPRRDGAIDYVALGKIYVAPPLSMTEGMKASAMGTFTDVPSSHALALDVRAEVFSSLRSLVHPAARVGAARVVVESLFAAKKLGRYSSAPTLARLEAPVGAAHLAARLAFGDPFPENWDEIVTVEVDFGVDVRAPGAVRSATVTLTLGSMLPLDGAQGIGPSFEPRLGPPTGLEIEDRDAFLPRDGVGLTPKLSWGDPSVGQANAYALEISEVTAVDGGTMVIPRARLFTSGHAMRVPPGVLRDGATYVAILTAIDDPARDVSRAPFRLGAPSSSAEVVTALFAP